MVKYVKPMLERLPRTGQGFGPNSQYREFRQLIFDIVEPQQPMTVRQVFYQAVVRGYVEKTEQGYRFIQQDLQKMRYRYVDKLEQGCNPEEMDSAEMRNEDILPLDWIYDTSRTARGSQGGRNESVREFLESLPDRIPDMHFIDLLAEHDFSIQVWLEKEALAGIVEDAMSGWHIPLYAARGYSSTSFLYEAAQDLERKDRPARIFHFGDFDPSGQNAIETIQRDLPRLAPKTAQHGIDFRIVAVTPAQIENLRLPTRYTKDTDTRAKKHGPISVELDAIEPNVLRQMVSETCAGCYPAGAREARKARQEAEREEIRQWLTDHLRTDE